MTTANAKTGPLSFQQEDMVRTLRAMPETARRYDFACLYELRGEIDPDCLSAAVEDLVRRHDVLRTTIYSSGGEDRQRVHPQVLRPLRVEAAPGARAADLAETLAERRLGAEQVLAGASLFRSRLFQLGPTRQLLAVQIHHLLYDGLSLGILWRDLSELYEARRQQRAPELPLLALTYLEYAEAQRRNWPKVGAAAIAYWREAIRGAPTKVPWPPPRELKAMGRYETCSHAFELSGLEMERLREASRRVRTTPFLFLMAATAAAIGCAVGTDDVVLGADFVNRGPVDRQEVIGHMINTRLSRSRLDRGRTLEEVASELRDDWLAADEHADAYIAGVLDALGLGKPTVVVFEPEGAMSGPRLAEVETEWVPVKTPREYWRELFVYWTQANKRFQAEVVYRPYCVDSQLVAAIGEESRRLIANPCAPVFSAR